MVPAAGLEPARPKARDFKSLVSTIPPRGQKICSTMLKSVADFSAYVCIITPLYINVKNFFKLFWHTLRDLNPHPRFWRPSCCR